MQDTRVRYSPTLGVWTVDMQAMTYMGGAMQTLASAMHYAREAGEMRDCTCFPETSEVRMGEVRASEPGTHKVYRRGAFTIYGHGILEHTGGIDPTAMNKARCPLANGKGEAEAERLAQEDLSALWNATRPFPTLPGALIPVPLAEPPEVWEGEAINLGRGTLPARHVHADTRSAVERLTALRAEATDLDREAAKAARLADSAPTDARNEVARKAAAGERSNADAVATFIRDRKEAAEAAKAVADGTRQAVEKVRKEIAAGITDHRDEWLAYLHTHAAYGVARLDALADELATVLDGLADVDRVRQTVERPSETNLFTAGSSLAMGDAVASVRRAREQAAQALASLGRHVAREQAPAA